MTTRGVARPMSGSTGLHPHHKADEDEHQGAGDDRVDLGEGDGLDAAEGRDHGAGG